MKFYPQEEGLNEFLNLIKVFGKILEPDKSESNKNIDKNTLEGSNSQDQSLSMYLKSSFDNHPLKIIRRHLCGWLCNSCGVEGTKDIPSYHCTFCDYDLCINCAKKFIKEGKAKQS